MDNYIEEAGKLVLAAFADRNPYTAIDAVERAAQLAVQHQDELLELEVRAQILFIAFRHGLHDKSLALFPWLIGQAKKHQELINTDLIVATYTMVVNGITEFPGISKPHIQQVLDQMEHYFTAHGYSLREAYQSARHAMLEMGDSEKAAFYEAKMQNAPPGKSLHNNPDSELYAEITYLDHLGNHQQAIEKARPFFDPTMATGMGSSQPCAALFTSFFVTGNPQAAIDCYHNCQHNSEMLRFHHLWYIYRFMLFYGLTRNEKLGLELFERAMPMVLSKHALGLNYLFFLAAEMLFSHTSAHGAAIKLRLPPKFVHFSADGHYSQATMLAWLRQQIDQLEIQFNQRNGNRFFTDLRQRHKNYAKYCTPEPVPLMPLP